MVDELFSEEQKLVRETVRSYVKKEISPVIEDYAQRAEFPEFLVKQLGDLGCFGPTIPEQYGGGKEKAKPIFQKAVDLGSAEQEKPLYPHWGLDMSKAMLAACQ